MFKGPHEVLFIKANTVKIYYYTYTRYEGLNIVLG